MPTSTLVIVFGAWLLLLASTIAYSLTTRDEKD
jgi:hypothetical protein